MGIQEITVSTLALFLLLQQPWLAQSIDLFAPLAPLLGDLLCSIAPCGKGTCKTLTNETYECVCDSGWTQLGPPFMPCAIPNCTLDYSCLKTPGQGNQWSPLDACFYANCGGGTCNDTVFPYKCDCDEGYGNLLNNTLFSCVKDCALGVDCRQLQIPLQNSSTITPNNTATNGSSVCSSGNLILLLILGISMSIIVPWR